MEIMEDTTTKKVKYDLNFVLSPLLPEEKVAEEVERMRALIEKHGGTIFDSDMPKLRALAYPVTKTWAGKKSVFDQGQFGWLKIEIASIEIPALTKIFAESEYVLRFALTYAYLDVRPVRKAPYEGDAKAAEAAPVSPQLAELKNETTKTKQAPADVSSKKPLTEEEIDKQIEGLLA